MTEWVGQVRCEVGLGSLVDGAYGPGGAYPGKQGACPGMAICKVAEYLPKIQRIQNLGYQHPTCAKHLEAWAKFGEQDKDWVVTEYYVAIIDEVPA